MMLADNLGPSVQAPISSKTDTLPAYLQSSPPDIAELRKMFDDARNASQTNRIKQQTDRDYYDGPEQLNSEVRRVLKSRAQPAIYTNRVRPAIDGVLGVLDGSKVDPRAYPRNPNTDDENAADVATKTLRFIAETNRYAETKLDCAENFLIEGTCAAIIQGGKNVTVDQIRHEEFFHDPYARRNDFKDATYMGIAKWMDASFVKAQYPDAYKAMGDPLSGGQGAMDATWRDRPDNFKPWVDRTRQRLMVVEVYYNRSEGWLRCVYCAQGVFEHGPSPYTNRITGESLNPIEAESCYVDRQNQRYGRVRDMIPIQDEINARRSRLLHLANSRQIQEVQLGAPVVDANTARREAARADGVIPPGWQLVPTADLAAGQQLLLAESKSEIDRMGPTPAVLGRADGSNQSGRSRQVLQQAGMTELARPLGRLNDWETRCYRQMWLRAQHWEDEMFIRVTDDAKAPEFLKINEPVMGMVMAPVAGPDGQPVIDPATGQPQMMPTMGQTGTKNRIAEMDMDIIVDTAPDSVNLAQEVWQDLLTLAREVPIGTPQFMIALEMSPLPDKQRVIERLKAWQAEQQGQPDPAQEALKQLAVAEQEAQVEKTKTESDKNRATVAKTYFEMGKDAAGQADPVEPPIEATE